MLWVALEFLFPNLFPWRMGNSQMQVPVLIQIGDLTGPYGLSFVIVWVNAGMTLALARPRRWRPLLAAVGAAVLVVGYGALRMPAVQRAIDAAPVVSVGLVQANVGIYEKGNVALFDINLDKYRELSAPLQSTVDVLIWPESVAQMVGVGARRAAGAQAQSVRRRRIVSDLRRPRLRLSDRAAAHAADVQQRLPDRRQRTRATAATTSTS